MKGRSTSVSVMDKWRGKVAIVTGASSGIGAAIAASLVREGVVVVGLARREDKVKSLSDELSKARAPGKLYAVKTDLRKDEEILSAFVWVEKELGGADILVNNSGITSEAYIVGSITFSTDGNTEAWRETLEVNVLGVAICTREYLKSMKKRNNNTGHIIIISSIYGHLVTKTASIYVASKHAVRAFGMCLRKELAENRSEIKVTTVCPGLVATDIFIGTTIEDVVAKIPSMKSEDVAKVVVDALSASSVTQICEIVMNPTPTVVHVF